MAINEVRLRAMESVGRDISRLISGQCPEGVGFALLLFSFGKDGDVVVTSNADRDDMVRALRECADRFENGTLMGGGDR